MANENIVAGLFGMTPQMYERQLYQQDLQQGYDLARLDPGAAARAQLPASIGQLGRGIAGAMGIEDPQLQRITQQAELLKNINLQDPQSLANAAQQANAMGNTELAMKLLAVADQAQARLLSQQTQRQAAMVEQIRQGAYRPGTAAQTIPESVVVDQAADTSYLEPQRVTPAVAPSYDINRVAIPLQAMGVPGYAALQAGRTAQAYNEPKYEKAGDVWYKMEQGKEPVAIGGVFKKGEKIAQRTAQGWSFTNPSGDQQATSTENPISSLIDAKGVHSTVVPYAQVLAKSWGRLDPDEQDKAMQNLTTINNQAVNTEANQGFKVAALAGVEASRSLQQQMVRLQIEAAQKAAIAAADGKQIPLPSMEKLAKQSNGVSDISNLASSFKQSYVGFGSDLLGKGAITIALRSSDPKSVDFGQWWQTYQNQVNQIRNDLFGAALTNTEKAEFDRAIVTPGMSGEQAQANLERQSSAAQRAFDKITKAAAAGGYSKSALEALSPQMTLPSPSLSSPNSDLAAQAQAELAKRGIK